MTPLGTTGPGSLIARHRHWYAQERDADAKMLAMLASVPEPSRADPRFAQALRLAGHLAACRENHLALIRDTPPTASWWPDAAPLETLAPRFAALEADWSAYLDSLDEAALVADYVLRDGGMRFLWNVEGQVFQLLGHACYHRGQIHLLVDQLGGVPVDTDYVDWAFALDPRYDALPD